MGYIINLYKAWSLFIPGVNILTGIWCFKSDPGLVPDLPLISSFFLSDLSNLSQVDVEILSNKDLPFSKTALDYSLKKDVAS